MIGQRPCPPRGQRVVYTLMNPDGEVVYVGETANLAERIGWHRRAKAFSHWMAQEYDDRPAALAAERSLIAELRPRYNRGW